MNKKKRYDLVFYSLLVSSILVVLFLHWFFGLSASNVSVSPIEEFEIEDSSMYDASDKNIKIMSYNVHYGKGILDDNDFSAPKKDTIYNLNAIVDLVKKYDVDILAVQEIDFYADRSSYIDQVKFIATKAGFKYAARAIAWDVRYVPFPYWPPSKHYGRVKSGTTIFSKYPIKENVRYIFEKPADNSWYYNLFYLDRLTQGVVIQIGDEDIILFNTHLEAFKPETRVNQIQVLASIINNLSTSNIILLGDLNSIPPEAYKKNNYEDDPELDYSDDSIKLLRESIALRDIFTNEEYSSNIDAYNTYPAYRPNRKLDYIFISDDFSLANKKIITEANYQSDHLPVYTEIKLK